jgi:hypothetical protein
MPVERVSRVYGDEAAISAWIEQRSLGKVRITLTAPGGTETAAYAFEIDYTAWDPDQRLRDQLARIRRQIAKEPRVRSGTDFNVIAYPRAGWVLSDQPGWSTTNRLLPTFSGGYRHGAGVPPRYWALHGPSSPRGTEHPPCRKGALRNLGRSQEEGQIRAKAERSAVGDGETLAQWTGD